MGSGRKPGKTSCECCGNYVYDEDNDYYICEVDLDEDEMGRFLNNTMYYDAGRTVFIQPDHTDGTIQSIAAAGQKPARNDATTIQNLLRLCRRTLSSLLPVVQNINITSCL